MSLEFGVRAADLAAVLGPMASLASRKPTIEVLKYVRVSAQGERVLLDATDTVVRQTASVPASVDVPGTALLPAQRLHSLVKLAAADDTVTFVQKPKGTQVSLGSSKVMFQAPDVADFPNGNQSLDTHDVVTVLAGVLRRLVAQVRPAVPPDDYKGAPAGLSLVFDDTEGVTARSTNGYVALEATHMCQGSARVAWIIPTQATSDLLAFLEVLPPDAEVVIAATPDVFIATAGEARFSATTVAKTFPNMSRMWQRTGEGTIVVNRADLNLALRRMAVVQEQSSPHTSPSVRLAASASGLVVSAVGPQTGDATQHVAVDHTGDAWDLKLSSRYVLDFLRVATGDQVTLEFTGESQPTIWRDMGDGPFRCLIAQMRD